MLFYASLYSPITVLLNLEVQEIVIADADVELLWFGLWLWSRFWLWLTLWLGFRLWLGLWLALRFAFWLRHWFWHVL